MQQLSQYAGRHSDFQQRLQSLLGDPNDPTSLYAQLTGPQETTSTTTQDINQLISPEMSAEYQGLANMLREKYEGRLERGSSLPPGYETTQAQNINESFAGGEASERNEAARRGISADTFTLASHRQRRTR